MKFWLIFVTLKVVEVLAIVFVPHFLGKVVCSKFDGLRYNDSPPYWVIGFVGCLIIIAIALCVGMFISMNLEFTKFIIERIRG